MLWGTQGNWGGRGKNIFLKLWDLWEIKKIDKGQIKIIGPLGE